MRSNTQKHRKGFILGYCIISMTLVTVFASAILMSLSIQSSSLKLEKALTNAHYKVSQIGEDFLAGNITSDTERDGYTCEISGNTLTVTTSGGNTVLIVEKNEENKIVRWHTSDASEELTK